MADRSSSPLAMLSEFCSAEHLEAVPRQAGVVQRTRRRAMPRTVLMTVFMRSTGTQYQLVDRLHPDLRRAPAPPERSDDSVGGI
jgi:hypothetical protein